MPRFAITKFFRRSSKSKKATADAVDAPRFNYDRDPRYRLGIQGNNTSDADPYIHNNSSFARWLELPPAVLQRVLGFVCRHSSDETYETCEKSALDACMLCDLRDLAHTGMTCKTWRKAVLPLLYHSIRLDPVHYCEREIYLSERRKQRRFDKNGEPEDPAAARLRLLCRTVRDDPTRLGARVLFFKTPYMLRESQPADLARTIAVLPNLRYVDLPDGFFSGDSAQATLRLEVQMRCPDLRKMIYQAGNECGLEALASGNVWPRLEVLEIGRVNLDPAVLIQSLASLVKLRALKVSDSRILTDGVFLNSELFPQFPVLEELILENVQVTSAGLMAYLARANVRHSLKSLSLTNTAVTPLTLQDVLANAENLQALSIVSQADTAFPPMTSSMQSLACYSLQTLRYEITAKPRSDSYKGMLSGYYTYLAHSLFAGGFPKLTTLYVRDQTFPDLLLGLQPLLPPPGFGGIGAHSPDRPSSSTSADLFSMGLQPPTSQYSQNRLSSNNPFTQLNQQQQPHGSGLGANGLGPPPMLDLNQTLTVFTKGEEDLTWGMIKMDPIDDPGYAGGRGANGRRRGRGQGHDRSASGGSERPLSTYGLADVGVGWRGASAGARCSVLVSNAATGGFLAIPGQSGQGPRTSMSQGQIQKGFSSDAGDEWPRPKSSQGTKGNMDLWR